MLNNVMIIQKTTKLSPSIQCQLSENFFKIRENITLTTKADNRENQRCILILVLYNNLHRRIYKIQDNVITHQTYRIFENDKSTVPISEKFHNPARIRNIHKNRYIPLNILVNRDG
jgi:hypothetical protein